MPANESASADDAARYVMPTDVRKAGWMRKLKGNKRKYFVLRLNDLNDYNRATLSYYDNERKFRSNPNTGGQSPKRTIHLNDCFTIAPKVDPKHKHVLALYTKEDCLCTGCEDETQLADWLDAIRVILRLSTEYQQRPLRDFEHIWQVSISKDGLGLPRNIHGLHRICLRNNVLYLVRVDPSAECPVTHEFPLSSIRRCGHTTSTFFLELGRSALIGPGELWIQTEDQLVSQNMHEAILAAMSSGSSTLEQAEELSLRSVNRPRSSSTCTEKSSTGSRNRGHNSSFKHNLPSGPVACCEHGFHHHHAHNGQMLLSGPQSPATSRERLHSGSWSRTTSECSNEEFGPSALSSTSSSATTTPVGASTCGCDLPPSGHQWTSPNCCSPYGHGGSSVDFSNGSKSLSSQSIDCESDHSASEAMHACAVASLAPLEPTISEDDFFPSSGSPSLPHHSIYSKPSNASCHLHHPPSAHCCHLVGHPPSHHGRHFRSPPGSGIGTRSSCFHGPSNGHYSHYLPPVPAGTTADYLTMSPGSHESTSHPESDHHDQDDGYLDMAPLSPSSKSPSTSGGNVSSNPVAIPPSKSSYHPDGSSIESHLEKVRSYYGNDEETGLGPRAKAGSTPHYQAANQSQTDDSIFNGLTRAYSTGSRPQPLAPSIGAQCVVPANPQAGSTSSTENTAVANSIRTTPASSSSSNNKSSHNRIRAFSTGSHGLNLAAIRLNSRRRKLQQMQNTQSQPWQCSVGSCEADTVLTSSSASSLIEEESVGRKHNKASSAPVLSPLVQPRTRSATIGSKPSTFVPPAHHHVGQHKPAVVSSHHHLHHHHCHLNSTEMVCSTACKGPWYPGYEPQSPVNSTVLPPQQEPDLMELDYSNNAKNNRPKANIDEGGTIMSGFEEELLREAKKKERDRINNSSAAAAVSTGTSGSGGKPTTAVNTASSGVPAEGRKRSDSTSTIGSFFGPPRPAAMKPGGGHLMDNLVASFKHSLNIQSSESRPLVGRESDSQSDYILLSPGSSEGSKSSKSDHKNKSTFGFSSRMRLGGSGKTPPATRSTNTPTEQPKKYDEEEEYTVMAPLNARPGSAKGDKSVSATPEPRPVKSSIVSPKRRAEDEEGSTYVMMAPAGNTSHRAKSSSQARKGKASTVRSLISSLSGDRKKGSSFSLRLNRPNNDTSAGQSDPPPSEQCASSFDSPTSPSGPTTTVP